MTEAADPWRAIALARVPEAGLAALARVRHLPGVGVRLQDGFAWVHWPAGRLEVVQALWPVPGALFFRPDGEDWLPFGKRLPTATRPPAGDARPLAGVIVPDRLTPMPPTEPPSPLRLGVVRGGPPQPATALMCSVADLAAWVDTATSHALHQVRAAVRGDRVLLLGSPLPVLPRAVRFWGEDVLVPVGHRPDPPLPAVTIREAVGARTDELVLLGEEEAELVPRSAFAPLTRPGVRLAQPARGGA